MLEWIRFALVALFFAAGLIVLFISIFGTFRFNYSLNRMHSAAMCDTLILMLFITGLIIASGIDLISIKFFLIVIVQWCTSPLVSHIFVKTKLLTDKNICEHCEIRLDDENLHKSEIEKEENE
ncbi:MAG: monovalent cation/H(+) antiporter subunit G [Clostridia bacterium]|nr:monovalent cation/H(+) antiporter subunit G [Clostridia bacterium]